MADNQRWSMNNQMLSREQDETGVYGGLTNPGEMVGKMFSGSLLRNNLFDDNNSNAFGTGQDAANLGLSMWNNSSSNPVFTGAEPGGASMGATVPESHLYSVLEEVLRKMGINMHGSVFNPNTNPAITGALTDGLTSGLQNREVVSQPTPTMSNDAKSANQVGNAIGQNLNVNLASGAINNCRLASPNPAPSDDNSTSNLATSNPVQASNGAGNIGGDKETRELIGQYMDQHTNVYSKPETTDGKDTSWKDALANQDKLSGNSIALVNIARQDLITHLEGGNVGDNHPHGNVSCAMMNADAGQTNAAIAQNQRQQLMTV
ncbi:hypothetical protein [Pantoea sp. Cy-640]|nr:hypothetical protein [Pantoea sp. Cy-640]NIG12947.1 hypothetical protein [Pantoea sp. Cy-640]